MALPLAKHLEIAEKLRAMEARNQAFWKLLDGFLREERERLKKRPEIRILDVACGECEESRVLTAYFGGNRYDEPSSRVSLVGIDSDPVAIENARQLTRLPALSSEERPFVVVPKATFLAGDATRPDDYPEIFPAADLVVVRHQFLASDVMENSLVWTQILTHALYRLDPEGVMLVTSYKEAENEVLLRLFNMLPCLVVRNELNPFALPLGDPRHPDVYHDKIVTLVKRIPSSAPPPRP